MFQFYLLLLGVTITWSKPSPRWKSDQIVYSSQDIGRPDGYSFGYQTQLGNYRNEQARVRTNSKGIKYLEVIGSYAYTGNNGRRYSVSYKSDDRGYQVIKPMETYADEAKFNSRYRENTEENIYQNPPQSTFGKSHIFPKVEEHYDNSIDPDNIQFVDETATVGLESGLLNQTLSTTQSPDEDITDSILFTTVAANDTLLKVGEKVEAVAYDEEGVGNRVGLPPGLIGSLLGGG